MKIIFLEDEYLTRTYRQSPFILYEPLILAGLGLGGMWYFGWKFDVLDSFGVGIWIITIVIGAHSLRKFLAWYKTQYMITNQRLIKVLHDGLFSYAVTETTHDRILNIGYKNPGFASSIGRFGNVEVQAVGLVDPIVLAKVSKPEEVKNHVWQMHTHYKNQPNAMSDEEISQIQERIGYTGHSRGGGGHH